MFDLECDKETCCAVYTTSPCAQHRALPAQTSLSEELIQTVHWSQLQCMHTTVTHSLISLAEIGILKERNIEIVEMQFGV